MVGAGSEIISNETCSVLPESQTMREQNPPSICAISCFFCESFRGKFPCVDTPPLGTTAANCREELLREQLVSLAVCCPHTRSNPSVCPLHEVRKLEPAAILDWLDGLSAEQRDYLMLYHQCCLVITRESDSIGERRLQPAAEAFATAATGDSPSGGRRSAARRRRAR